MMQLNNVNLPPQEQNSGNITFDPSHNLPVTGALQYLNKQHYTCETLQSLHQTLHLILRDYWLTHLYVLHLFTEVNVIVQELVLQSRYLYRYRKCLSDTQPYPPEDVSLQKRTFSFTFKKSQTAAHCSFYQANRRKWCICWGLFSVADESTCGALCTLAVSLLAR